ncbi:hypothetical protein BBJ28_00007580 [Nothophytophthora sp. Chile5]|nr:hypothetical protein BBJ28_00007580 [Nothophytophthora sp. Chile5]
MARRAAKRASGGKPKPANGGKKSVPKAKNGRKKVHRVESGVAQDVFSEDEAEAEKQDARMDARADVDGVYEYQEPTFADDDSEVDEDEAFDSADEQEFGMFFGGAQATRKAQQDEESEEEEEEEGGDLLSDLLGTGPATRLSTVSDDEADDADESVKLANLSKMVDGLVEKPTRAKKLDDIDARFATAGGSGGGELTLGSLLGAPATVTSAADASDEEDGDVASKTGLDLRRVRQQVRELEGDGTALTLQANREAVHDARASRKLAYSEKVQEVDLFEPVVRRNRHKETLDLRAQAPKLESLTAAALTSKFVPQTEMEKSVAALLQAGDLTDKQLAQDEQDELARKRVSTQEVAARQKELAKLRALLFYEEQKQKRVKKIKSKLYHKIRNSQDKKAMAKQQEQLRALDPEMARKLDEELAEKRAEERLTLKHRNTSKWVKHQLRRGVNADDATRGAIADQLRRGEELRRKMDAVDSDDEMDDAEDDDDAEGEGDAASRLQKRLEKQASALVTEIDADAEAASKKRGLQGMKFMQRAAEKQREKARSEAEKLLREIRRGDGADGDRVLSEGEDYLSSGEEGAAQKKPKRSRKAKKNVVTVQDQEVVAQALAGGALQTSSVSMNSGVSARASGAIAVDLGEGGGSVALADGEKVTSKSLELGAKVSGQKAPAVSKPQPKTEAKEMEPAAEGEENPWLSTAATKGNVARNGKKNKKKAQQQQKKNAALLPGGGVDVAAAIESLAQATATTTDDASGVTTLTSGSNASKGGKKRKLEQTQSSATTNDSEQPTATDQKKSKKTTVQPKAAGQDELVRRAFEFVADDEDELALEKDRLASRDSKAKKGAEIAKLVGMSGWGSWAGEGIAVSKRQLAREQQAKDLARAAKQQALAGRKDAKMEKVLINEKKDKRAANFSVKDVPYPFTSREEYESAMRNPLGSDWNTATATNALTAPKIMKRAGTAIAPLVLTNEDRKQAKKEFANKRKAKF